jgi:hypothetical protein
VLGLLLDTKIDVYKIQVRKSLGKLSLGKEEIDRRIVII